MTERFDSSEDLALDPVLSDALGVLAGELWRTDLDGRSELLVPLSRLGRKRGCG